jgi:hypothetical protein
MGVIRTSGRWKLERVRQALSYRPISSTGLLQRCSVPRKEKPEWVHTSPKPWAFRKAAQRTSAPCLRQGASFDSAAVCILFLRPTATTPSLPPRCSRAPLRIRSSTIFLSCRSVRSRATPCGQCNLSTTACAEPYMVCAALWYDTASRRCFARCHLESVEGDRQPTM